MTEINRVKKHMLHQTIKDELAAIGTGGGAVESVNGKTGTVELNADDVGASAIGHDHYELHEHTNKSVLDDLTDNEGALQYNGSDVTPSNLTSNTLTLGGIKLEWNSNAQALDFIGVV